MPHYRPFAFIFSSPVLAILLLLESHFLLPSYIFLAIEGLPTFNTISRFFYSYFFFFSYGRNIKIFANLSLKKITLEYNLIFVKWIKTLKVFSLHTWHKVKSRCVSYALNHLTSFIVMNCVFIFSSFVVTRINHLYL